MAHTTQSRAKALRLLRDRRRRWLATHGPCVRCRSNVQLEIHHRDPEEKVSHRVWSWSRARRIAELAKCDVLCRRCHAQIHSENAQPHGRGAYDRGCRCDICRAAKAAQVARYRASHIETLRVKTRAWRLTQSYRDRYVRVEEKS